MSYIETDPNPLKPVFRFHCRMATKSRNLGRNLLGNFVEEDSDIECDDTIKVFLRLKPTKTENDTNIIEVMDSKTILFRMPPDLAQCRKKLNMPDEYKYTFSNVFQANVTQADIYNGCVAPLIKDLFAGQHCLLFTYGTTNAGKTFTVLGTGDQPGIIPRTLTTVFKSIRGKEYTNSRIRPVMFRDAEEVNEEVYQSECNFKQNILNWNPDRTQSDSSRLGRTAHTTIASSVDDIIGESVFKEMQRRLTNDTTIVEYEGEPEDRFSVWVSFGEIYNDNIFDLLQPVPVNCKRKPLKLAQDSNKNCFIKGLKHVFIQSEEEAYKVLMFGKNNLHVAATGMNLNSSRSHCIFSIKLMKYTNVENTESPDSVIVSSFSICDLAGAERQKKTLNVGLRLKESQNINGSLHVLSRCFKVIRENQVNKEKQRVPFRDSKLTQLFQHALQGKESVTMIVNVNSDRDLCEETQHVLKATAVAKHIVVQPKSVRRPQRSARASMFSQVIFKHNRSTLIRWDSCVKHKAPDSQTLSLVECAMPAKEEPSQLERKQDEYENLLSLIETLKEKLNNEKEKHIQTKRSARKREDEIRDEMREEFNKLLEQAKQQDQVDFERTQALRKIIESKRGESPGSTEGCLPSKKPRKETSCTEDDAFMSNEDLKEEIRQQRLQIEGLTDLVNMQREEKKELSMNLTSAKMQLSWKDKEIQSLEKKIEIFGEEGDLQAAYLALEKDMESKIKMREVLLEEARADVLEELSKNEDLEAEVTKLEKDLACKDDEIEDLKEEITNLKEEIVVKTNALDMLENHIDEIEVKHDEDMTNLERQCSKLEKDLQLKHQEIQKLNQQVNHEGNKIQTEQMGQLDLLNGEISDLKHSLALIEDQLQKQLKEFQTSHEAIIQELKSFEEENLKIKKEYEELFQKRNNEKCNFDVEILEREEKIKKLQEKVSELSVVLGEVNDQLRQQFEEECDEKMVELTIKLGDENEQQIQNMKKEFNLVSVEQNETISKLKLQIKEVREERDSIRADLEAVRESVIDLQKQLDEKVSKVEALEKSIGLLELSQSNIKAEYSQEVFLLEKSSKKQIQETTRLMQLKEEACKQVVELNKRLKAVKADYEETLKKKEHELECTRSEIIGYQKSLPTLQSELETKRKELNMYIRRVQDQNEIIFNMEKEIESFKANQQNINRKYEEQLKKTKEETEHLKKENARIVNFFRSTPTPKKELEKKIESLQKQNIELSRRIEELQTQPVTKDGAVRRTKSRLTSDKENEDVFVENHPTKLNVKARSNYKLDSSLGSDNEVFERERAQSLSCRSQTTSEHMEEKKCKSTSKPRTRRTKAPTIPIVNVEPPICDNETSQTKMRKPRRNLYNSTCDVNVLGDDLEAEEIPQDSPRTMIKRTLRSRHKCFSATSETNLLVDSCVGCGKGNLRRKLFYQNYSDLHSLHIDDNDFGPNYEQESPLSYKRRTDKDKKHLKRIIV